MYLSMSFASKRSGNICSESCLFEYVHLSVTASMGLHCTQPHLPNSGVYDCFVMKNLLEHWRMAQQTEGRYQVHYLPSSLSYVVHNYHFVHQCPGILMKTDGNHILYPPMWRIKQSIIWPWISLHQTSLSWILLWKHILTVIWIWVYSSH